MRRNSLFSPLPLLVVAFILLFGSSCNSPTRESTEVPPVTGEQPKPIVISPSPLLPNPRAKRISQQPVEVIQLASWVEDRGNEVAFSPDGRLLAVATTVGISLYDADNLDKLTFIPSEMWVRSLSFSPDGTALAGGVYDHRVRIWRVPDGTLLQTLEAHTAPVHSAAFSPDGETLASAAEDDTIRLWDTDSGALLRTLDDGVDGARSLAFSPDGEYLAAGLRDGAVGLWRTSDWQLLRTFEGHTGWCRTVAFSPDGQLLASGSFDTTARIWRVSDGKLLQTLEGHTASVLSVAFSPDGQTLATGSVDYDIRLWWVESGALLTTLKGHTDFIFSVAFSPNGQNLASSAMDNSIRVWDVSGINSLTPIEPAVVPAAHDSEAVSCVVCHHPKGDFRPARVIDASCELCHPDGASLNWDPTIPRDPDPVADAQTSYGSP